MRKFSRIFEVCALTIQGYSSTCNEAGSCAQHYFLPRNSLNHPIYWCSSISSKHCSHFSKKIYHKMYRVAVFSFTALYKTVAARTNYILPAECTVYKLQHFISTTPTLYTFLTVNKSLIPAPVYAPQTLHQLHSALKTAKLLLICVFFSGWFLLEAWVSSDGDGVGQL